MCGLHNVRKKRNGDPNIVKYDRCSGVDGTIIKSHNITVGIDEKNNTKLCECGCGTIIKQMDDRYRLLKYAYGHSSRIVMTKPEIRKKIADGNIGIKKSDESKLKMRMAYYLNPRRVFYDTLPERFLESIMKTNGLVYDKQKSLEGRPDFFIAPNNCIFVDGCYYHACNIHCKKDLNTHQIKAVKNDIRVTDVLKKQGYKVIRLWEHDIYDNPMKCLENIKSLIMSKQ